METCPGPNPRSNIPIILSYISYIEYDNQYAPSTTMIVEHTLIYNLYV
jgi:hypothetical protein